MDASVGLLIAWASRLCAGTRVTAFNGAAERVESREALGRARASAGVLNIVCREWSVLAICWT